MFIVPYIIRFLYSLLQFTFFNKLKNSFIYFLDSFLLNFLSPVFMLTAVCVVLPKIVFCLIKTNNSTIYMYLLGL